MEDVLDLYQEPWDEEYPVINLDEKPYQLLCDAIAPLPCQPGHPRRVDYTYKRKGTCNLFVMVAAKGGIRHIKVTDKRTSIDYAICIRQLVELHFPHALKIRIIQDNLNTHTPVSLYKAFPPEVARRLLKKVEFHYTPKHASWLNAAEIEISLLGRQCINRRIGDTEQLQHEVCQWQNIRNEQKATIDWRFSVELAREKLARAYPTPALP